MKCFTLVLVWAMMVGVCGGYGGEKGTAGDPCEISSVADLLHLANHESEWGKHFVLTGNLDLSGVGNFPRIGTDSSHAFSGVFDGGGFVLSNLNINLTGQYYVGLFGYLGAGGQILDMGLENITITGRTYVGGLAGSIESGTVSGCYVTGSVTGEKYYTGGLAGINNEGTVTQSYAMVDVSGTGGSEYAGGLVGINDGTVMQCYATGEVIGNSDYKGGLVGLMIR